MSATRRPTITEQDARRLLDLVVLYADKDSSAATALEAELERAGVVAAREIQPTVITMNSRVACRSESGVTREVEIVYPRRADASAGRISVLAPLGRALLGASVGDRVTVGGRLKACGWVVESLRYQPEAAGDFHL